MAEEIIQGRGTGLRTGGPTSAHPARPELNGAPETDMVRLARGFNPLAELT